ncbi:hypothetical protein BGY98DRAFT_1043511, partial [Russula aff. rugulosa BPL654]
MLFDWFRDHTLEPRSDWNGSTMSERLSHIVFYSFPPLFVASRPLLLPRPAAQETASKFHPIRPSRPPFTLSFPLSFDFWAMMINASHRAATVRPSHAVLLIPSS